ncbi:hypothetical protein [Mesorhizobium sp. IMUNJ 23232]|uniref:hypothetical protein n=1 Tax=Mesorhizobium sp. IMUNJ 23232 TaxID=3376064 RepID=UPI00378C0D60
MYELEERIEQEEDRPGVLLSHTILPFLNDFSVVTSFQMNVLFSPDLQIVDRLSSGRMEFSSYDSPKEFVRRFFDDQPVIQDLEADELVAFVNQLLALERRYFLAAMRAMRTYVAGMHRIADDLALAYTLLVSAIEALAQDFDGFSTSWSDVDERKRIPIDRALTRAGKRIGESVREAVINSEHASLARRYRAFALSHVGSDYFHHASGTGHRVGRRELDAALQQAYSIRSSYVHTLKKLPDGLAHPFGRGESAQVKGRPVLTLQGLARLTRHIIRSFIASAPKVDREPYNYVLEQSGIMSAELAAEYWIGRPLGKQEDGRRRFEGLLNQLTGIILKTEGAKLTDLRSLLAEIEQKFDRTKQVGKPRFYALYVLFNGIVPPELASPAWLDFMKRHAALGDEPESEILIARTYFQSTSEWPIEKHRRAYDRYWSERWKPSGLHAPRFFEAAMTLALAERYRTEGNLGEAHTLLTQAADEYPERQRLREFAERFDHNSAIEWRTVLVGSLAKQIE